MAEDFVSPRRLRCAFETRAPPAPCVVAMYAQANKRRGRGSAGGAGVGVAHGAQWGPRAGSRCSAKGGIYEISASPSDGLPVLPLLPGYAARFEAGLLAASPGRDTSPPGRALAPDAVLLTGAQRIRRRERARTQPRHSENSPHGTRIGLFCGFRR
jgi:hypothetical protein